MAKFFSGSEEFGEESEMLPDGSFNPDFRESVVREMFSNSDNPEEDAADFADKMMEKAGEE